MDEFVGYAVGNNWVQHGRPDVNQFIWTNHWHSTPPGIWGIDNNLYTKKAPGISLAAAPLIWLGHTLPGLNAIHTSLLLSALVTAATGSLLLVWLAELGLSRRVAALTALIYGLATIAWVYARFLWEHSLMAFLFLLAMWALWRAVHRPRPRVRWPWVLLCSVATTLTMTMRFEAALAVALFGAYLFIWAAPLPAKPFSMQGTATLLRNKTRWLWALLYGALPALTLLWLLYFNAVRFGSASETGYNREILFQRPWEGTFGLLFSPSTGMFIYMPVMLLLIVGVRPAWRRLPHSYVWLGAVLSLFYWIFYGSWFSWGSTWVWGPRFLLHTLPLLMLPHRRGAGVSAHAAAGVAVGRRAATGAGHWRRGTAGAGRLCYQLSGRGRRFKRAFSAPGPQRQLRVQLGRVCPAGPLANFARWTGRCLMAATGRRWPHRPLEHPAAAVDGIGSGRNWPCFGLQRAEYRRQSTEGQSTEVRSQKLEVSSQQSEVSRWTAVHAIRNTHHG